MIIDTDAKELAAGYRSLEGYRRSMALYDSVLERWGTPYETHVVPTRHGKTHAVVCGKKSAPPLVLLHGASVNATMWQPNAAELSKHFRLILLDIPGHMGKSDPVFLSTPETHVEWLVDVFDAFGLKKPALGGASLGGWVVLHAAANVPERIDRLVLVATYGNTPFRFGFIANAMRTFLFPTQPNVVRFLHYISAPGFAIDPQTIDYMLVAVKYLRPNTNFPSPIDAARLSQFKGRALHIVGENETVCDPQRGIRGIKELLPDVRSVLVPNAGHMVNGEQVATVNKAIIEFMQ